MESSKRAQDDGSPLRRDNARFRFLAPDRRPELPYGLSGTLSVLTSHELVRGRLRDVPEPSDV